MTQTFMQPDSPDNRHRHCADGHGERLGKQADVRLLTGFDCGSWTCVVSVLVGGWSYHVPASSVVFSSFGNRRTPTQLLSCLRVALFKKYICERLFRSSVSLSICPSFRVYLYAYVSVYFSACLYGCLSCLPICLSVYPFNCPSDSAYLYVCLSVHVTAFQTLSVYLYIYIFGISFGNRRTSTLLLLSLWVCLFK